MTISRSKALSSMCETVIRSARGLTRAIVFNRVYLVAMCATIIAIGSCGIYAITAGQASDVTAAQTSAYISDVDGLVTGLDREYAEVLSEIRQHDGGFAER